MDENSIREAVRRLYLTASSTVTSDVRTSLRRAYEEEENEVAKTNLKVVLDNLDICEKKTIPVCSDTGYPVWYIRVGEGSLKWFCEWIPVLRKIITEETKAITLEGKLRPTVIDPIDRANPGTNVGEGMPFQRWKFDDSGEVEITCAPKGGGTEIFGSSSKVLLYADGLGGVKNFVLESVTQADLHGKACPPNIVGVGIGGTFDLCAELAKEAAVLRPIGSRHPDPRIAKLEQELFEAINLTGIGPLGMLGRTTALDVHVEFAYSHLAGFPVAVAFQCPAARVSTALIAEGGIQFKERPNWFRRMKD